MILKILFLMLTCLTLFACDTGGGSNSHSSDPGPYQIVFSLDDSFQIPHGNQPIRIALVRLTDGLVLEEAFGTVSAIADPTYTFSPTATMERGTSYAVHYWIDSNIGGGTLGLCDPTDYDHQWSTEFFMPTNDINFAVGYEPALTEYVCDTFP